MIIITPNGGGAAETHRSIMVLKCCYAVRSPCASLPSNTGRRFFRFQRTFSFGVFSSPHGWFSFGSKHYGLGGSVKNCRIFRTVFFRADHLFRLRVFDIVDKTVCRRIRRPAVRRRRVFFIFGKKPYYPSFSGPIARKTMNVYRHNRYRRFIIEHHEYSISKDTRNL